MKKINFEEFVQFIKDNLKYNQLAYHKLYVKCDAKSNYEKKQLKEFYDLVKGHILCKKVT